MMKHLVISLIVLCCFIDVQAQKVTRNYDNVTMSEALRDLNEQSRDYTISFMYNELEDFRVTTNIKHQSVPEALRQIIGFYPIRVAELGKGALFDALRQIIGFYPVRVSERGKGSLFVECIQKTSTRYKGHIVDEKGQPVAYANVYLLAPSDTGCVVGGGVSNEAGLFVIPCDVRPVVARISFIGYKTLTRQFNSSEVGTIRMQPDSYRLNGVEVKGSRPLVRIKDDAFVTTVEGSYLSKMGTGNDVQQHRGIRPRYATRLYQWQADA